MTPKTIGIIFHAIMSAIAIIRFAVSHSETELIVAHIWLVGSMVVGVNLLVAKNKTS